MVPSLNESQMKDGYIHDDHDGDDDHKWYDHGDDDEFWIKPIKFCGAYLLFVISFMQQR